MSNITGLEKPAAHPSIKPKIVAIIGPTASGKTSLSIALAKKFNGEIVSADSRQVYRGMDIGTAKASFKERALIPHHLVDIKDPDDDYTVADFQRDAIEAIGRILRAGKLPLLVGGTGLYVRSVVENLDIPEVTADPELRMSIETEIRRDGLASVFKKLVALDPEAQYIVDPKNPRRVVRALEVAMLTGKPFTAQRREREPLYDVLEVGINPTQEVLHARIDRRIDQMMRDGLLNEVENLIRKYGTHITAFDAIGYREIINSLDGAFPLEEAVALMKTNTWRYAKRQITWFKKDKKIRWINTETEATEKIQLFLKNKK